METISDLIEANGKTIRQNNLEKKHEIPIGSLIEITANDYPDDENPTNGLRLLVVNHSRDCDGTPLYDLSFNLSAQEKCDEIERDKDELRAQGLYAMMNWGARGAISRHYSADSLKVIRPPK